MGGGRAVRRLLYIFVILLLASLVTAAGAGEARSERFSASDSLTYPGEKFVLTKDELALYNMHTLQDILDLVPGVVWWQAGPPGAYNGYSIDGRSHIGVTLLMNGVPFYIPYGEESLDRFLPFSRLKLVEVSYSGSPAAPGDISTNGFVNFIIEEGSREGPESEIDFTFGKNNRRARRAWFSTPRSHISAAITYDQFLHDSFESLAAKPTAKIGEYDTRTVLLDLYLNTQAGDNLLLRLQRFEDDFGGTALSASENIRYSGYNAEVKYTRSGFSALMGQRQVEQTRLIGRINSLVTKGSLRWDGRLGRVTVGSYAMIERTLYSNILFSIPFDPEYRRLEGGGIAGGEVGRGFSWRAGIFGGSHSDAGGYVGGEAVLWHENGDGFSQYLSAARRLRLPSGQELYQPGVYDTVDSIDYLPAGNTGLEPELSDEVYIGASRAGRFSIDLFMREERSRIVRSETSPSFYYSNGSSTVSGGRFRFMVDVTTWGIDTWAKLGADLYSERSPWTPGIPAYRILFSAQMSRRVFKETETVTLRWDSRFEGKREWAGVELGAYDVHTVSISMTLLSAILRGEVRNLLDERYETVPGYYMPGRYWTIGIIWSFFD
jgi:hypothetical protein